MAEASTLVVLGMMGRMPVAGVTWQALQYLEGFRRLGFDVHYVEDTGEWSYDPDRNTISDDPSYAVGSIGALMARHSLAGRWAYRAPYGRVFGLTAAGLERLFERAGALVNLTGATVLREEHRRVPVRIYLETDPVLPQIEVARGDAFHVEMLSAHTHHFTYGENLGQPDCGVPVGRFAYRPTRPPVVLDWWEPAADAPGPCFTTVASWRQAGKDVEWQGQTYTWSKHHEFLKLIDLPRRTAQPLELGGPELLEGRLGHPEVAHCSSSNKVPRISLLRPTNSATTTPPLRTVTSYTPSRPSRLRSTASATRTSPSRVGARNRISAPAATVLRL